MEGLGQMVAGLIEQYQQSVEMQVQINSYDSIFWIYNNEFLNTDPMKLFIFDYSMPIMMQIKHFLTKVWIRNEPQNVSTGCLFMMLSLTVVSSRGNIEEDLIKD